MVSKYPDIVLRAFARSLSRYQPPAINAVRTTMGAITRGLGWLNGVPPDSRFVLVVPDPSMSKPLTGVCRLGKREVVYYLRVADAEAPLRASSRRFNYATIERAQKRT